MYNLLISASGWAERRDTLPASRAFEHTEPLVRDRFLANGRIDFDSLIASPALFAQERSSNDLSQTVRIGRISRVRTSGRELVLDYSFDETIPAFTNQQLIDWGVDLDIEASELWRTHWAIKDADLFQVLLRELQPRRQRPKVFAISDPERVERSLVSAMMPFHPSFDAVYETLQAAASSAGLLCRRADDIWESPLVIQDVVSLIDRSAIVVCDCTGRNANVFYEAGIAHTLGREVILITQSDADIPFDLRHLRYVRYLNNGEGRAELATTLAARFADLAAP